MQTEHLRSLDSFCLITKHLQIGLLTTLIKGTQMKEEINSSTMQSHAHAMFEISIGRILKSQDQILTSAFTYKQPMY